MKEIKNCDSFSKKKCMKKLKVKKLLFFVFLLNKTFYQDYLFYCNFRNVLLFGKLLTIG